MTPEPQKVFVVKFRGGPADGVYRLALGEVPAVPVTVVIEATGERVRYRYDREEPQTRDVHTYDPATKTTRRERVVEAFYQIFVPERQEGAH